MIHPTALIDSRAQLDETVAVGAYTVIGADVRIGQGCVIGPHVVIHGPTEIGQYNRIFQFASLGADCQDLKYKGEPTKLVIGNHNCIREFTTLHRGTVQDRGETVIGDHCLLMAYVHIAHDCVIGDHVIMANQTTLAGHVQVGSHAVLGGNTLVHQFCHLGAHIMTAVVSIILKDVPSYILCAGAPVCPKGINSEGLRRRGFSEALIAAIKQAYRVLYRQGLSLQQAIERLDALAQHTPELLPLLQDIRQPSKRGLIR